MSEMPLEADGALLEAQHFLQENAAALREIASVYVVRMGLARKGECAVLADEIFQDAMVEVLAHPEGLVASRQPRAWVMGVLANIVKRRRAGALRRDRFEVVMSDVHHPPDIESEEDLLNYLVHQQSPGPEETVESTSQLEEMLALISAEDSRILRLALIHELRAEKLGELLNVTPGAARVRVHRALHRLRLAWQGQDASRKRGKGHE
jgi:RNA polymerase sigma factor (sigma-70 family)